MCSALERRRYNVTGLVIAGKKSKTERNLKKMKKNTLITTMRDCLLLMVTRFALWLSAAVEIGFFSFFFQIFFSG